MGQTTTGWLGFAQQGVGAMAGISVAACADMLHQRHRGRRHGFARACTAYAERFQQAGKEMALSMNGSEG